MFTDVTSQVYIPLYALSHHNSQKYGRNEMTQVTTWEAYRGYLWTQVSERWELLGKPLSCVYDLTA